MKDIDTTLLDWPNYHGAVISVYTMLCIASSDYLQLSHSVRHYRVWVWLYQSLSLPIALYTRKEGVNCLQTCVRRPACVALRREDTSGSSVLDSDWMAESYRFVSNKPRWN